MLTKVLITGGAGFVGSNLVRSLARSGKYTIVAVDNFETGREENLLDLGDKATFHRGDITIPGFLDEVMEGIEFVLHQAAIPSVRRSLADPVRTAEVNIIGTIRVLEAARKHRVKRVVYAASSSVYGNTKELPKVETMQPNPLSPYAVQKLTGEQLMRVYAECFGVSTISLRYFNVFGPYQDPNSMYAAVIPRFITRVLAGAPPEVFGDGEQTRDFTYIENVVTANVLAIAAPEATGQVINIAGGTRTSLNQMLQLVCQSIGRQIEPLFLPPQRGDVRDSLAALDAAERTIGYKPVVPFEEGLRRTVEWYTSQRSKIG